MIYVARSSSKIKYIFRAISLEILYQSKKLQSGKQKLTARASDTLSRCFVKFVTAVAILRFVTYIRSEKERP